MTIIRALISIFAFSPNWCYYKMTSICENMRELPYSHLNVGTLVNVISNQSIDRKVNNITISSNNNFFFSNIDPDVQLSQHCAHQQCKYYDLKLFNSKFSGTNHISMIHTNIKSSKTNLRDFLCNLENLNI